MSVCVTTVILYVCVCVCVCVCEWWMCEGVKVVGQYKQTRYTHIIIITMTK